MFQKKFFPSYLLMVLLILGYFLYSSFSDKFQPGQTFKVVLSENGFSPQEITIRYGDSVEFTTNMAEPFWPASDLHPTHGIYPKFDPQEPIEPDKTWTFQFLKSGRWKFHDHLNPIFRGTITVK